VAAEAPLRDLAVRRAAERQPHMLQLDDRVDRLARQHLRRILIGQIVATLNSVEHVPFPVIFLGVAERGADAALGRPGVRPGGVQLRDDGDIGDPGELHGGHQAGPARTDDYHIVLVIGTRTNCRCHLVPPRRRQTRRVSKILCGT
jgi:hypothetical protein